MKIDLHVHTKERSGCARASAEEQIQAAIAAGLDALVFTDHARLAPPDRLRAWNVRFAPFRIFGGIEITVDAEDLLVLGVQDSALERTEWTYPALHAFVREAGGFIALAHPFRYWHQVGVDLDSFPPDAIEIYTPNTPRSAETQIRALAACLNLPLLSNSDAHTTRPLGKHYNRIDRPVPDEGELIIQLKAGRYSLYAG